MNCSTTTSSSKTNADNSKSEYKRLVDYSQCRAQTPPRNSSSNSQKQQFLDSASDDKSMRNSRRISNNNNDSISPNKRSPLPRGAPTRPIVMMTAKDRAFFGVGCFGRGSCREASTATTTSTSSSCTVKRDSLSTLATTTTTTTTTSSDVQLLHSYSSNHTASCCSTTGGWNYSTEHTTQPQQTRLNTESHREQREQKMMWLAKNRFQRNLRQEQEEIPCVIQVVFAKGKTPFRDSAKSSNTVLPEQVASPSEVGSGESVPAESNQQIRSWKDGVSRHCGDQPHSLHNNVASKAPPQPQRVVPARSWSLKTLTGDRVVHTSSDQWLSTTRRSSMSFVAGSQIRTIHRG